MMCYEIKIIRAMGAATLIPYSRLTPLYMVQVKTTFSQTSLRNYIRIVLTQLSKKMKGVIAMFYLKIKYSTRQEKTFSQKSPRNQQ